MSGLFGGHKDTPTPAPVTLPAPVAATPQAVANQGAAQDDALRRAQLAGTLATDGAKKADDTGTYSNTSLG